jgi:integrase
MGIFKRYNKTDRNDEVVLGSDGKPVKTGPWFVQYPYERDAERGKIKYRTIKTTYSKKKAEEILRAKVDAFQEKDKLGISPDFEMSFTDLMDWGLGQAVMQAKASKSDDVTRSNHLKQYFGKLKAIQITPLMVENFRVSLKVTKSEKTDDFFSGSTINKMVSLARRIYYLAMDQGIVNHNPFARRGVFPELPKGKYIPDSEFRRLLSKLRDYLRPLALKAYLTGMRRGEILNLRWNQVNLFQGIIELTEDDTKTSEPRQIFFNSVPELKKVIIHAQKVSRPGQELVFSKSDGEPVPKWYMERLFKKACIKAGVGPYRFHDLRHTFNTNMLKAGVSQKVIMKLTGHKTDAMFSRYTHLDEDLGTDAMQKLVSFMEKKDAVRSGE